MSEHLTPAELAEFASGDLPRPSFPRAARHLLRCSECRVLLAPHYAHLLPVEISEYASDRERVYDERLDRAFSIARSTKRQFQREETRRRRVSAFLAQGGGLDSFLCQENLPFQGVGVLQALLDYAWSIRHENPNEMVRLDRYAVEVAGRLDTRQYGARERADWQARAWAELGNAYRASDHLNNAEWAFGNAFDFLVQGTGDLRLKAKLYDLHASYYGTRREFTLAFAALNVVHQTYEELGEFHLSGRTLIVKAVYRFYEGCTEEALQLNKDGLDLIDQEKDPDLFFMAVNNRILYILDAGRYRQARIEFFRYQADLKKLNGRTNAIKMLWLRARIYAGLKDWSVAEQAFLEVIKGWEEIGLELHAALASLELALISMQRGHYTEAEPLVLESAEVFLNLRLQREALGAVMVLRDTFKMKLGTLEHLEDVVTFLRRWHLDPNTKFVPRE